MIFRNIILYAIFLFLSICLSGQTNNTPYTLPSNFREADCIFESESFDMTITEKFRSETVDVSTYYSAVVGDLDGDGFSEIVIPGGVNSQLKHFYIFNHKAELVKKVLLPNGIKMDHNHDSVILADLDNDGKSEIIISVSGTRNAYSLFIYDFNGDLITSESFPTMFPRTLGVADFNKDGLPEIYAGTRVYSYNNRALILIADGGNSLEATVAQDVNGDGLLDLVSVNSVYEVRINSLSDIAKNSITRTAFCSDISSISQQRERTFALADIDLDGTIDVVTVVPISNTGSRLLEVKVWNPINGSLAYSLDIPMQPGILAGIRNSWPFIGDTDGDGYPDIVFMGGLASKGHTSIYRLEYDPSKSDLVERVRNNKYNDYSSMSTSMSMFDFNNDGKQEIVYRDESSLYIINGETLEIEQEVENCHSGTGWEYPVVASLTPSGESFVVMASGDFGSGSWITTGSLRIYGADTENGAKPWIPARKVWNQYSFYQNIIDDDLTIISNPAPLNYTLESDDKQKRLQPFNGHMMQLGIIRPSTLESVYPLADVMIDKIDYGYIKTEDTMLLDISIKNDGAASMDPDILVNIYKVKNDISSLIYTYAIEHELNEKDVETLKLTIPNLSGHQPFDKLEIKVGEDKFDCNRLNNEYTIFPEELNGIIYVKKGELGRGTAWDDAVGELSDALSRAEKYPGFISQVWVASGTYEGSFEMLEGVDVHGGFAGNETDFNKMDTVVNKVYVDAKGLSRALTQIQSFEKPTEWAGVILQNGLEQAIDKDVYGGGAYLMKNGILRYSTIKNSKAVATSNNNKVNAYGGGVYLEEGASLRNSIIDNNIAEVKNNKPNSIEYGVAHGGGVDNVENRLTYLIIRNNKTVSSGNTDGGAIYSSGDVINSIINNNNGQSVIFLEEDQAVINNTVVNNIGEYTVSGAKEGKVQNSIIYNNTVAKSDFNQVSHEDFNNLLNINPDFQPNSFKLLDTSKARGIGNATFFPTDLDKDMLGYMRFITLQNDIRAIDAGVYQTDIKTLSATEKTIEVPFGTKFEELELKDIISVLLEADYTYNSSVIWEEGNYNGLKSGEYILTSELLTQLTGVTNPDNIQGMIKIIVLKNDIATAKGLTINGQDWLGNIPEQYLLDCDCIQDHVPINITLASYSTIKFSPEIEFTQTEDNIFFELDVSRAGIHRVEATITSENEENTEVYPIAVVRYFPFWSIIEQKWNNTFVINNNKENNGDYQFASYKWFENDIEIGTRQYYSAGGKRTDLLDDKSLYHAEMVGVEGMEYITCKESPVLMNYGIKIYPNPVQMGGTLTISAPIENGQQGTASIYSLSGLPIKTYKLIDELTTIEAPAYSGIYIIQVSIEGGVVESQRVVVY